MKTSFEYRSYVVSFDGAAYRADSSDGEPFTIRSKNMLRVTRAIDTLWNALDGKIPAPAWLHGAADLIDVDAASEAMLVVDHTPTPVVPSFPIAPVPATLQAVA
ncbi:hypothetical protein [Bradyrhizobium elkanii]|uniref:Uncharacterized protein n=1 Tax=Bradyrhizobium diazoefficiens TaxID=1355477 RepID=A0A809ZAQ8_9BRAD|nr:hypothetical protein XF1B_49190 [Bradyrhizobium diazoefficiens]BCE48503.1 hypothetical protein XF4B_48520 [Bradyrhizobium diazoefficiens]BCE92019.1 hypothetical protein XF10B_48170 [Bradyrhizobium diazoefficiens]BCF26947.1 hypothetical protein XF14B_48990 [Bradyrhizobium diazoefficiens]